MAGTARPVRARGSRYGFLLLSTALASLPVAAFAETLYWDAGDPATAAVDNANGDWDVDTTTVWRDGSGAEDFNDGDDVEFRDGAAASDVTVRITEDVAPRSITFGADPGGDTSFTIVGTAGSEILSSQGVNEGGGNRVVTIAMGDDATINAGLDGRFDITGTGTLTLGGNSPDLIRLTVEDDLQLVISSSGDLDGTVEMIQGDLEINGTVENVDARTGTTVDLNSTGVVTGILQNAGQATIAGDVGELRNTSTGVVTFDGSMQIGAAGFENRGAATILSGVEVTVTGETTVAQGTLTVNSGGSLVGDVDVRTPGTFNLDGAMTGDLESRGTVSVTGTLTGATTVLDGTTTVAATGVLNGTATVGADGTLDVAGQLNGDLETEGTVTVTGTVTGATSVLDGTTTVAATGVLDGDVNVAGAGTLTVNGELDGNLDTRGTVTLAGLMSGDATVRDGTTTIQSTATVNGSVTVLSAGTLISDGVVTGDVDSSGQSTLGGSIAGKVTVQDGTTTITSSGVVTGGAEVGADGTLTIDGTVTGGLSTEGAVTVTGTGSVGGAIAVLAGTTTVQTGGALNGDVTVAADGELDVDGSVTGDLVSDGEVTLNGTLLGAATVQDGSLDVGLTGVLTGNVGVTGGTLNVTGQVVGNVDNQADGTVELAGSISGILTNAGVAGGGGTLGALDNLATGQFNVEAATTLNGYMENAGSISVSDGVALTALAGGLNQGTIDLGLAASISGGLTNTNTGIISMQGGSSLSGGLANAGILRVDGSTTVEGLSNSGTIDLADGAVGDVLTLTGSTVLNGRIELDVDLSGATTTADLVAVSSAVSGNVVLAFSNSEESFGTLTGPITVMTFDPASSITATAEGLVGVGALSYRLDTGTAGQLNVNTFANPGVGALAGSVTLTQSLIGSVINRPSSPFVTGLAGESDKACRPGVWARALGGKADATGTTETVDSGGTPLTYDSEISASYAGVQIGGDLSCFEGFGEWDMSFGGILGVNTGDTVQPVYAIDPNTGSALSDIVVSNNSTDFSQTYAGVYVSAVRDRLLFDLQYRLERTEFDLTNDGTGNERIGILDQSFDSKGQTLSGSMSYVFALNEDRGINLVPTLGFAITKSETDPVAFEGGGRLEIDDASTEVGFMGATLSMSRILPSGKAALTYFATGTYYKDFADPVRSVYYDSPAAVTGAESFSSNLGAYGEASLGVNYTQLLEPGAILNAKQLNASARVDGRFGDTLDSWGITAQLRLQF